MQYCNPEIAFSKYFFGMIADSDQVDQPKRREARNGTWKTGTIKQGKIRKSKKINWIWNAIRQLWINADKERRMERYRGSVKTSRPHSKHEKPRGTGKRKKTTWGWSFLHIECP